MGVWIDCKPIADGIKEAVRQKAGRFEKVHGRKPGLEIITVGSDPVSEVYVRGKERDCDECGIFCRHVAIGDYMGAEGALMHEIDRANEDNVIDGIIVQLPLPKFIEPRLVAERIDWRKDVDGITPENTWRLYEGDPYLEPCTPAGIMKVLNSYNLLQAGKNAAVLGRSRIVGKPMAQMLQHANMTVTVCHSRTPWYKLADILEQADIVVSAVGKPGIVKASMLGNYPTIIDVGIVRGEDGKLHGDCEPACIEQAGFMSPVPGGIGLMTRAMLMSNVVKAASEGMSLW